MATHSSVLAWRIPGTGEPGGLPSMGHTDSDRTEATKQQQQQHTGHATWLAGSSPAREWTHPPSISALGAHSLNHLNCQASPIMIIFKLIVIILCDYRGAFLMTNLKVFQSVKSNSHYHSLHFMNLETETKNILETCAKSWHKRRLEHLVPGDLKYSMQNLTTSEPWASLFSSVKWT